MVLPVTENVMLLYVQLMHPEVTLTVIALVMQLVALLGSVTPVMSIV